MNPLTLQIPAFAVKLMLLAWRPPVNPALRSGGALLASLVACSLISASFSPYAELGYVAQQLGAIANMALSVALLNEKRFPVYIRVAAVLLGLFNLIFLAFLAFGQIPVHFGRCFYFGDAQPNLGAEIAAIGTVAAAMSLPMGYFLLYSVPAIMTVQALQGRSALLAILLVLVLKSLLFVKAEWHRYGKHLILASLFVGSFALLYRWDFFVSAASNMFLLDDEYRGVGTGLVGRDARWAESIRVFQDFPFSGAGPGFYETLRIETPHNLYLYGFSEYGSLFVFVLVILVRQIWLGSRYNPDHMILLGSILVLTIFNDRFINLNPYPNIAYVMLICCSAWPVGPVGSITAQAMPRLPHPV